MRNTIATIVSNSQKLNLNFNNTNDFNELSDAILDVLITNTRQYHRIRRLISPSSSRLVTECLMLFCTVIGASSAAALCGGGGFTAAMLLLLFLAASGGNEAQVACKKFSDLLSANVNCSTDTISQLTETCENDFADHHINEIKDIDACATHNATTTVNKLLDECQEHFTCRQPIEGAGRWLAGISAGGVFAVSACVFLFMAAKSLRDDRGRRFDYGSEQLINFVIQNKNLINEKYIQHHLADIFELRQHADVIIGYYSDHGYIPPSQSQTVIEIYPDQDQKDNILPRVG